MTEVTELTGGVKQKWLRDNHELVLSYYGEFGPGATCEEFNLKPATLQRFLDRFTGEDSAWREPSSYLESKVARLDSEFRALEDRVSTRLRVWETSVTDNRRDIRELTEAYERFLPALAENISQLLVLPLLRAGISVPEIMTDFDRLGDENEADNA